MRYVTYLKKNYFVVCVPFCSTYQLIQPNYDIPQKYNFKQFLQYTYNILILCFGNLTGNITRGQ